MGTSRQRFATLAHRGAARLAVVAVAAGALALGCRPGTSPKLEWNESIVGQIEAWRQTHEANYRRDWATIEGLHFLATGSQSVGSAADNDVVLTAPLPPYVGSFTLSGNEVTFDAEPGVLLTVGGTAPTAGMTLRDDAQDETDEIEVNGASIVVHRTGTRIALRIRDPNGERAKAFQGFSWFPINRDYRVAARFIRDAASRDVNVVNTFGDVDAYPTEGVLEFALNGDTLRLRPFTTEPKHLYIVFKDASSGDETYEAARFLTAELRDDGTTILDFNRAYNPPCAFNPFTTCPIPLRENWLPVKVLAGEKKYAGHVDVSAPGAPPP
jgi:hypothetical protein